MNNTFFINDEYWKKHIDDSLEDDLWIRDYPEYFNGNGLCLDLGCGIGQYTKEFMDYGYEVISADISKIAIEKVREFNKNAIIFDMNKGLPFDDKKFDIVFANLSIHFFSDDDTKKLINEVKRVLRDNGLFIGSVNGLEGYNYIKDTAVFIENHYYFNKNKYIRLFGRDDLMYYLGDFKILKIEKKESTRFNHSKNFWIFIVKK